MSRHIYAGLQRGSIHAMQCSANQGQGLGIGNRTCACMRAALARKGSGAARRRPHVHVAIATGGCSPAATGADRCAGAHKEFKTMPQAVPASSIARRTHTAQRSATQRSAHTQRANRLKTLCGVNASPKMLSAASFGAWACAQPLARHFLSRFQNLQVAVQVTVQGVCTYVHIDSLLIPFLQQAGAVQTGAAQNEWPARY